MSTFTDWLEDKTAKRVVLIELEETGGTHYFSDAAYRSGPSDSPANQIYKAAVISDIIIERELSGVLGLAGGAANLSELTLDNSEGDLDGWADKTWKKVTVKWGDPSWSLSTFSPRWVGRVADVSESDLMVRFSLVDNFELLRQPIQSTLYWTYGKYPSFNNTEGAKGARMPLCYGWPKNITPIPTRKTVSPGDVDSYTSSVYHVHEPGAEIHDTINALYLNNKEITGTLDTETTVDEGLIDKANAPALIIGDETTSLEGEVTLDVQGVQNDAGTALRSGIGAIMQHMLTRTVSVLTGVTNGSGSSTENVLDERASDNDDEYNGKKILFEDPTNGVEDETVSDYDGSTKTVTHTSLTFVPADETPYAILDLDTPIRVGPLQPSDLDTAAFDALDDGESGWGISGSIGMYINEGQSGVQIMDEIMGPAGYHFWKHDGKYSVGLLVDPSGETADLSLDEGETYGDLEIIKIIPPTWRLVIGYDRSYTQGKGSEAQLDDGRESFTSEAYRWTNPKKDHTIRDDNPRARDLKIETFISRSPGVAGNEADRIWQLFNVKRKVYVVNSLTKAMQLELGEVAEITDSRHNLSSGKNFFVIGMREDLTNGTCELVLWA